MYEKLRVCSDESDKVCIVQLGHVQTVFLVKSGTGEGVKSSVSRRGTMLEQTDVWPDIVITTLSLYTSSLEATTTRKVKLKNFEPLENHKN